MRRLVCRTLFSGLAAAALGLGAAAHAQDAHVGAPTPPPADLSGVTITAPRTIERNRDGVTSQIVTMSVHVSYADLDMHTPGGVSELNKRVSEAANYVCRQLDTLYPNGTPEEFYCAKQAIGDARPQVIKASAPG